MAQQDPNSFPIDPFTTSGVELATIMNEANTARISGESGTSRPSYAEQGYTWLDVTTAKNLLKFYTGTVDLSIIEYDTTNNKAIINGGSGFTDKSRSIIHKFSEITGVQPAIADMVKGEFYENIADGIVYYLDNNGALKSIGAVNTQNVEASSMSIGGDFLSVHSFKNKLINGGFDVWQRGTSQTTNNYGSDDRWYNYHQISTKTHSQQVSTDTERALFNSNFFSRTVATSVAGASALVVKIQKIENVALLAGKTVTLSFWAKADASKNIAIEFKQNFGTGGTPSTEIDTIGSQLIALTTSWAKYSVTLSIPSIVGKTLGTDGIHTSSLQLIFWFDAGSDFNTRSASLGQQSGTFDIAEVQIEEGSVATPFEARQIPIEETLCKRYFQLLGLSAYNSAGVIRGGSGGNGASERYLFPVKMRVAPTVTGSVSDGALYALKNTAGGDLSSATSYVTAGGDYYYNFRASHGSLINGGVYLVSLGATSYIAQFDAEL